MLDDTVVSSGRYTVISRASKSAFNYTSLIYI